MANSTIGIRFQGHILREVDNYAKRLDFSRSQAVNTLLAKSLGIRTTVSSPETQDQVSGAAANEFGRKTARALAAKIGAQSASATANEFLFDDRIISLKCASRHTQSVGVTYKMLERVDAVVGAFEASDGLFDLYELPPDRFRKQMRPTRSTGPSAGRVGLVSVAVFRREGKSLGRVRI